MKELSGRELTLFIPVIVMVVWLGIYPKPYFSAMDASVTQLLKQASITDISTDIPKVKKK